MALPDKTKYVATVPDHERKSFIYIMEKLDKTTLHDGNLAAAYAVRNESSVKQIAGSFLDVFVRGFPDDIQRENLGGFINKHRDGFISYITDAITEYGEKSKMPGHHPDYSGGTPLALVAIPNHKTKLVDMNFSQAKTRIGLYPRQAIAFAQALVDAAEEIIRTEKKEQKGTRIDEPSQN